MLNSEISKFKNNSENKFIEVNPSNLLTENSTKAASKNDFQSEEFRRDGSLKLRHNSFNKLKSYKGQKNNYNKSKNYHRYDENDDDEDFFIEAKLLEAVDEMSIIGFRQCFNSNRSIWNRSMWALFILAGFSLAIYQIDDRIEHYFSYPTSTEMDIVSVPNMTFPQITICNDNFITKSGAEKLGMVEYLKQFMPPYVMGAYDETKMKIVMPKIKNETLLLEKRKILSPGLEQIASCFWNGKPCPENVSKLIFTNLGQCIVINPRETNLSVDRPGTVLGLLLILIANHSDYFIQPSPSAGYRMLLHEPIEPPRMMELGFKINLGETVNVAVSMSNITRLKPPYGICSDDVNYHPVTCEWGCLGKEIIKKCKCRPIYFNAFGNESICDYHEERSCVEDVFDIFYSKRSSGVLSCDCPPLCNEINYQSSVTGSKYSRNFVNVMSEFVYRDWVYEDVTENHTFIFIFFSSLQYTRMTTVEAYSAMALLSDIGGALGLLLGSTLLTIFELIEFVIDVLAFVYAKKNKTIIILKTKKQENKSTSSDGSLFRRFWKRLCGKEPIYPYVVNVE